MEKIAKDKRNGSVCLLIGDGEKSFKTLTPELFGRNFLLKISALVFGMKVSGFGLGLLASLEMKEKSMNWWKCHKTLVFSLVTDNTLVCLKLVLNFFIEARDQYSQNFFKTIFNQYYRWGAFR
jgi:hypothetical protein